ncbi:MAG: tail fiber domain-containing protein [Bacteroidetes bacterium]|nr:tail fiber domain-containing protein [Bacteroidota bacterium]
MSNFLILLLALLLQMEARCQPSAGFYYHTVVRDVAGIIQANQPVKFRFSFLRNSSFGQIEWQEEHLISTDSFGRAEAVLGMGTTTGVGSSSFFSQIPWGQHNYYLRVELDISGGNNFVMMGSSQLFSVPYSLYSKLSSKVSDSFLRTLSDVDVTGHAPGKLLGWDGVKWVVENDKDSDSVQYSVNTFNSDHSDTSAFIVSPLLNDSVLFSYQSDSSLFSLNSNYSSNVTNSIYSDTALYAISSPMNAWELTGNTLGSIAYSVGSNDNQGLLFKTNNVSVAEISNSGTLRIGNSLSSGKLNLLNNDGLISSGSLNSSFSPVNGAGTKLLWYPSKGAFRAGSVDGSSWDTLMIGLYSTAFGENTKARIASFSSGLNNEAVDYSIAIGRNCKAMAAGAYPEGNSVALGDSCLSMEKRTLTIGKNNYATGPTSIAIGYNNLSLDDKTVAIGSYCNSTGAWSTTLGYRATSLRTGTFVFSDASSSTQTAATAHNQFMARASGGVVFYTDSLASMGVVLFSGAGSWAVVSDKNKKQNFQIVDEEEILNGITSMKVLTWNYRSQSKKVRHIGPTAQDFYSTFKVGESNISITTADMDGVIISGIKAIHNRIEKLQVLSELDEVADQMEKADDFSEQNRRLDAIEKAIDHN